MRAHRSRLLRGAMLALFVAAAGSAGKSEGQTAQGRTLAELKAEAQARADRNAYPLIGLKPTEVREALDRLTSLDRDEWAASWSRLGDLYLARVENFASRVARARRIDVATDSAEVARQRAQTYFGPDRASIKFYGFCHGNRHFQSNRYRGLKKIAPGPMPAA